jgi:2-amino-4-hydroxy-6-hydroxymethyldihydropteridine diphosphokinase
MATCLLGLGSNLGDRETTLSAALTEIKALPDVQLAQHSAWHHSRPIGGPSGQNEFLNAAALIETTIAPPLLLDELHDIENRHGRKPADRWTARTLDIDILLYGNEVMETPALTLPHPRMSFRRFVLEPAAEIAPKMLHPVIGWPIERLLLHLNMASDQLTLLTPSTETRDRLSRLVTERFDAQIADPPTFATSEHHWPAQWTTWLRFTRPAANVATPVDAPTGLPYGAAGFPKLSILIDSEFARPADKLQWSTLVRQPGRGPTLRLQTSDASEIDAEVIAAAEAVWC